MSIKNTLLLLLFFPLFLNAQVNTAKPWAYWWWMGSAVNEKDIAKNLEDFAASGFGGLHIIPIYGVKGEEANFINYLSPKWVEMLDFTVEKAKTLGLGIDMTLGTGWPYGGSHVLESDAAKAFKISRNPTDSTKFTLDFSPTKQKVKRAAPGAEGWVLDHFDGGAVDRYLIPFDSIFKKKNIGVRAFYNDSYEVYGANWTPDFFKKFKILRGYELAEHLDVLARDTAKTDREKRIWSDYHETISDLLYTDFTQKVVDFSHKHGKLVRNESHGSPANILDLYALNDMPESEFFGSKPYNIPLYRQDPDYEIKRFGTPDVVIMKFASSAANVAGRKLVTSETATWLGNHFKVSLAQIKPIVDESFVGGINHVFFHGIPYSPPATEFPGWLFYASTNFNQQSHFWETLPQLNGYIERCQERLQKAMPDNDILLYFPIYDMWHTAGKNGKLHPIDVHSIIRDGLLNSPFGKTIKALQMGGFTFDFVSDKQLLASKTAKNGIYTEGSQFYKTIVVPRCDYMPLATLEALERFRKAGVKVVFVDKMPSNVNGFSDFEKRKLAFDVIKKQLNPMIFSVSNLGQSLKNEGIRSERMAEKGLTFIRKKTKEGTLYFIANQNKLFDNGTTISLSVSGKTAHYVFPLTESEGQLKITKISDDEIEVPLKLASGESVFIEVLDKKIKEENVLQVIDNQTNVKTLRGASWQVDFVRGAPFLPKGFKTDSLKSWTILAKDTMAAYFSGTAKYTTSFNVSTNQIGKKGWLELGDVRESATVVLNGKSLGTAWCLPFKVFISAGLLKEKDNILEIEVTNVSANRIRYLDKKGGAWKKFYDINMVDIGYRPFDASNWLPVESGLLGPIKVLTFK
jgi:alpha-L-rhamnosidase